MDEILIYALLAFLLAGTIKGVVGIGLPTTSIGILSQITDPRLAITLSIFPIVAGNAWQILRSGRIIATLKRYGLLGAALAIVLLATTFLAPNISTNTLVIVLGVMIVLFSITSLAVTLPYLSDKYDNIGQVIAGALAGISGGLTAIWAPPIVMYFLARRIEKDEFVRASGVLLLCGSLPLLVGYLYNGMIDAPTAKLSAILIIPTLLGFSLGEVLRRKVSADRFRTLILVIFLLMGLNLLRRSFF